MKKIICLVVTSLVAASFAEEPVSANEPLTESSGEQQTENQNKPKPQSQARNPGVEFVPTEDISEDTSVPFPVDI